MICKSCGTECKGEFCPHGGEKLISHGEATPLPVAISAEPNKKARRPALCVKMVFWQSIALFLPLAYLFFDTVIVFHDALFAFSASGSMHLHRFMERLTELSYETNTMGEIMEITMGDPIAVFETVSPFFWRSAAPISEFLLPELVIVFLALFCAAAGVLLLFTGGRILRARSFVNMTLIAGMGAVFSPLLGMLLLRVQYFFDGGLAAADVQMQHIVMSLEAICVMGILMCALLPALASIRRVAAYARKEREFVCFPYRFLAKRSFGCLKFVAALVMIGFLALIACFFTFPIANGAQNGVNAVLQSIAGDWNAVVAAAKSMLARDGSISVMEGTKVLIDFVGNVWMLLVPIGALCALIALLGVLFVRRGELLNKKRKQKKVKKYAKAIFNTAIAPCVVFFVLQAVLCAVFLFLTPIVMHLNFSNVNDTLSVFYLTVAYIRTLGATNTLYAFLCVGGLLLWHMADQTAAALIVRAGKE